MNSWHDLMIMKSDSWIQIWKNDSYIWIHLLYQFRIYTHEFIYMQVNSSTHEFIIFISCSMNTYGLWIHMIISNVNSYVYEFRVIYIGMSCPSWPRHRTGYRRSPVRTLPVAPLWCDLDFCSRTVVVIKLQRTSALFYEFHLKKRHPAKSRLIPGCPGKPDLWPIPGYPGVIWDRNVVLGYARIRFL